MKIKEIITVFIKILGLFLIYGNIFRYSIGEIANINLSHLKIIGGVSSEPRWYVAFFIIFCYTIFIKNAEIISTWVCGEKSILEFSIIKKYLILKIYILTFGIAFIFQDLLWLSNSKDIIFILTIPFFVIGILLIISNSYITRCFLKLDNFIKNSHDNKSFIFLVVSFLFYFTVFRNPQNRSATLSELLFIIVANFFIFLITAISPMVYKFLTKGVNEVSLNKFIYILFFWLLLLYNIQDILFVNIFKGYYSVNENNLFRYLILEILLPMFLLLQNKYSEKIKSISIVRFSLYIFIYFIITSFIYRLALGRSYSFYSISIYFIIGMLILYFIHKLSFIDKFFNRFQLKAKIISNKGSKTINYNFIIIFFLLMMFGRHIFYDRNTFIHWTDLSDIFKIVLYESIYLFEIIILLKMILLKQFELKESRDFIKLLVTCFCFYLFLEFRIVFISYEIDYNSSFSLSLNTSNIFINIFSLILYFFSDFFAKKIIQILPKNHEERLFKTK